MSAAVTTPSVLSGAKPVEVPRPVAPHGNVRFTKAPTVRQMMCLRFLHRYFVANGAAPTLREIGAHMAIRSTNGVNDCLRSLERRGLILRRGHMLTRGTRITAEGLAALGVLDDPETIPRASDALAALRSENDAFRTLLRRVQVASSRLPKLTAEMVVVLGDVRDALRSVEPSIVQSTEQIGEDGATGKEVGA